MLNWKIRHVTVTSCWAERCADVRVLHEAKFCFSKKILVHDNGATLVRQLKLLPLFTSPLHCNCAVSYQCGWDSADRRSNLAKISLQLLHLGLSATPLPIIHNPTPSKHYSRTSPDTVQLLATKACASPQQIQNMT